MSEKKLKYNPLVSIVVITYNSEKYVIETLESVKRQTYQNIELIISDDGSQDNTVDVCQKWMEKNKDVFVRTELILIEKNTGIPANCNRGAKIAQGEWLKFIAGDDCFFDYAIESYISFAAKKARAEVIHAKVEEYKNFFSDENKMPLKNIENIKFNNPKTTAHEQFEILLRKSPVYAPTVFISNKLFRRFDGFDEKCPVWEDRPMWLMLTKNEIQMIFMNSITVKYRKSQDSIQVKKNPLNIFSESVLLREEYMIPFNKHLGLFERQMRTMEYKRKFILNSLGLNKIALVPKMINVITSLPFRLYSLLYFSKV